LEPPTTVGVLGAIWSSLAVEPAVGAAGAQADVLPARSTVSNCTIDVPSAVIAAVAPLTGTDQVDPPFADLRQR
jgi:hypothetical protein